MSDAQRYESAIRQIYTAAEAIERGEEPAIEGLQDIQRLCDAVLRGNEPPALYQPMNLLRPSTKDYV